MLQHVPPSTHPFASAAAANNMEKPEDETIPKAVSSARSLVPPKEQNSSTPPRMPTPPPKNPVSQRPPVSPKPPPPTITSAAATATKLPQKRSNMKAKSHGRKPSWEVFDPLLAGDIGSGVWGTSPEKDAHPLFSKKAEEDPLLSMLAPSNTTYTAAGPSKPPRTPALPKHRKTKSAFAGHRKTNSIEGLRQIAQKLSVDKPASFAAEQEELVNKWGDQKQKHSTPKVFHRKSQSLGTSEIVDIIRKQHDDGLVRSESQSAPSTPPEKKPAAPKRNTGMLTPPRWTSKEVQDNNNGAPPPPPPEMPTLTPLHGFLTPKDNLSMRSSEQDPSLHQVEIPPCDDFLRHSRLCAVLDHYRVVDQNFDFSNLVGKSRLALQGFCVSSPKSIEGLVEDHTPIVQSLLECSSADTDLVLEGFFHGDSENLHERVEVAVFNSQSRRQFVVVYRGTTDQQHKPVRNKQLRAAPMNLHSEQPVGVFPAFREAYFRNDLEGKVFGLLDQLSEAHPFCDVVMTGHSFGGALATIAALRFASDREMLRVSCHAFGTPKVGTQNWKQLVNSQSNLKVMRVERDGDACVTSPDANVWLHVGHTIAVHPDRKPPCVQAFRFEKGKPAPKHFLGLPLQQNNRADDIQDYVRAMEQFARLGSAWVKQYVGQDVGSGVRGTGNEKRQMV